MTRGAAQSESRKQRTAGALNITVEQLRAIETLLREAGHHAGRTDGRDTRIAARLGISVGELAALHLTLTSCGDESSALARAAGLTLSMGERPPARCDAAFTVARSAVFHRSSSCESTKGARLDQTTVTAAVREGRRVCTYCINEVQAQSLAPIDDTGFLDLDATLRPRRDRSATRSAGTGSASASRRRRAVVEAQRRGITVEQLKAERQNAAALDRALGEEARRLGITAKELRAKRRTKSSCLT